MSDEVCTIEGFGETLRRVCVQHARTQTRAGEAVVRRAAQKSAKVLRDGSATPRDRGEYAKGFTSRKTSSSDDIVEYTVGNAGREAPLVPLLENGHELVYFGRPTGTRTRAFPHVAPAFEEGADIIRRASVS